MASKYEINVDYVQAAAELLNEALRSKNIDERQESI